MAEEKFSKGDAIRFGWETVTGKLGFFIGTVLLAILVMLVPNVLANLTRGNSPLLSILFNILYYLVNGVVFMGFIKITLEFIDKKEAHVADLFACVRQLISYIPAAILYFLITLAGFILLVVPGVIWSLMFFFYTNLIVDRDAGPIESLKQSAAITKGAKWDLFLFLLLLIGINILGLLALGVGLLVTIPLSVLASSHAYRQLLAKSEGAAAAEGDTLPKVVS